MSEEELASWARANGVVGELPHRDDVGLAIACTRGDRAALAAFEALCTRAVPPVVGRFGGPELVAEVTQQVRTRLLMAQDGAVSRLAGYRGQGSLARFIQAVAVRSALNLLESDGRHPPPDGDAALIDTPAGGDDPELAAIKRRYRTEFKEAFAAAMGTLEEASRNALRLYYLDGLTLADLGSLYGWSVPTASRRLAAARAALLEATRATMKERLRLDTRELDSVLRLIESRLSTEALTPD